VDIGRHAKVRRAIIDKGVSIPGGVEIGFDLALDQSRGFTITENGITVIAKADGVERFFESVRATA
jgi:glucose-1-phosphate adenylyltransferase